MEGGREEYKACISGGLALHWVSSLTPPLGAGVVLPADRTPGGTVS